MFSGILGTNSLSESVANTYQKPVCSWEAEEFLCICVHCKEASTPFVENAVASLLEPKMSENVLILYNIFIGIL